MKKPTLSKVSRQKVEDLTRACEHFEKYRNPSRHCRYPFTPDPVGYCWSYACHVDGDAKFADIKAICTGCELHKK
jgi:acetyl-CoA carboxylase alpha subunit